MDGVTLNSSSIGWTTAEVINASSASTADDGLRLGFFTKADDYTIGIVFVTIGVVGVILNVLTMVIVGMGKSINRDFKIQIINMAVGDTLMASVYPAFLMAITLQLPMTWNLPLCQFARVIVHAAIHVSPFCSAAIGIERFIVVFFPFQAAQYSRMRNIVLVVIVWLATFLPELESILHAKLELYEGDYFCIIDSPIKQANPVLKEWLITLNYLIPALIVVFCYSAVCVKLMARKCKRTKKNSPKGWGKKIERIQLMLVVDAMLTLVTWLPYNLYLSIIEGFKAEFQEMYTRRERFAINTTLLVLMLTNAFSTPIVYFAFNGHFRADAKLLFKRIKGTYSSSPGSSGQTTSTARSPSNSDTPKVETHSV